MHEMPTIGKTMTVTGVLSGAQTVLAWSAAGQPAEGGLLSPWQPQQKVWISQNEFPPKAELSAKYIRVDAWQGASHVLDMIVQGNPICFPDQGDASVGRPSSFDLEANQPITLTTDLFSEASQGVMNLEGDTIRTVSVMDRDSYPFTTITSHESQKVAFKSLDKKDTNRESPQHHFD
jgi:Flp pilus assembly protein CpaB